MKDPKELFLETLKCFIKSYSNYTFYTERDVVWTIQNMMNDTIKSLNLPFIVINDYGIMEGNNRSLSVDLAILNENVIVDDKKNRNIDKWQNVELAIEFKYEPKKDRKGKNIPKGKFPVTTWKLIEKDIERVKKFHKNKEPKCNVAIAILIDEGSRYVSRDKGKESEWIKGEDGDGGLSILKTIIE